MSEPENPDLFDGGIDGASTNVTLRDLFAAFALVGICQWEILDAKKATCAFELADAMLAEREDQP